MKISCDIIRDLLPLYAEDMVSEASRTLVDDHLCGCDGCTKELAVMKKAANLPVDTTVNSLNRVKASIRNRRVITVLAAIMTIASILITGLQMCVNTQFYLPYEEAIEGVEYREDGSLVIDFSRARVGTAGVVDMDNEIFYCHTTIYDYIRAKLLDRKLAKMSTEEIEDYIREAWELETVFNRTEVTDEDWNRFFGIQTEYCFRDEDGNRYISETPVLPGAWLSMPRNEEKTYTRTAFDYNLIYMNRDGSGGTVLHAGGKEAPNMELYKKYGEAGYLYEEVCYGCGLLAAGLWLLLRKKKSFRYREAVVSLMFLFGCTAFGILTISLGQFNYTGERLSYGTWPGGAASITVTVFLCALLWRKLYVMNQRDRAQ